MRRFYVLAIITTLMAFTFSACQDSEGDKVRENARKSLPTPPAQPAPAVQPGTATPAPGATTNANVPHYKCPNNCAGGVGAAAGACPVCGTTLAHNQAYHNQPAANPATPNPAVPNPANPAATPPQPSPAQNAAGVYHYICSNGCAGGASGAGNCATCGGALTHNQAYHN